MEFYHLSRGPILKILPSILMTFSPRLWNENFLSMMTPLGFFSHDLCVHTCGIFIIQKCSSSYFYNIFPCVHHCGNCNIHHCSSCALLYLLIQHFVHNLCNLNPYVQNKKNWSMKKITKKKTLVCVRKGFSLWCRYYVSILPSILLTLNSSFVVFSLIIIF